MEDARSRFRREQAVFDQRRAAWIREGHAGRWAVIHADEVFGIFETSHLAWVEAIDHYQVPGFMVRRITEKDEPVIVSHVCFHAQGTAS